MRKRSIPGSGSRTERERTVQVPAGGGEGGFCAPALKETVRDGGTPRYRDTSVDSLSKLRWYHGLCFQFALSPLRLGAFFYGQTGEKKEETP